MSASDKFEGKKIMVVEDEEMNWFLVREELSLYKIESEWVEIGQKAVEKIKNGEKFDAILMDINLPGKNGVAITKEIKTIAPDIPIIAHTAFMHKDEVKKYYEVGCAAVIGKPNKKEEFKSVLQKVFG